jgi:predicted neuraminidase
LNHRAPAFRPNFTREKYVLIATLLALTILGDGPLYSAELLFPPERFHNHASSIVETPEGDFLACWFHGKGERTDDTLVISGSRKRKDSNHWSAPFLMADTKDLPDQNPVLFIDPRGTLWLFWVSSLDNSVRSYLLRYRTSRDYSADGPPRWDWQDVIVCRPQQMESTFVSALEGQLAKYGGLLGATPRLKADLDEARKLASDKLFQRLGWMTRQPPIMISDRRMMLGLYSDVFGCSLMAFTDDWGATWQFSKPILLSMPRNVQPALVTGNGGRIVAFMRAPLTIHRADSGDGGMTWTEVPMDIPNPGSSVSALRLKSGNWALVCNDTRLGRHLLTAYLSDDEGKTWKWKRPLENLTPGKGIASYPTVIASKDGTMHCTYTYSDQTRSEGKTIKHARFNEAWIKATEVR